MSPAKAKRGQQLAPEFVAALKREIASRQAFERALPETLNPDAILERATSVLNEPLYWFPVRHHSPAVALYAAQALAARKPKVVFLEAPADANQLFEFVVDKGTKPPVAMYSSYRDDDNVLRQAGVASPAEDIPARWSSFYPLLAYSPEYVVMRQAAALGAEVVFMDLPQHGLLKARPQETSPPGEGEATDLPPNGGLSDPEGAEAHAPESSPQPGAAAPGAPELTTTPEVAPGWERLVVTSGFYAALAEAGGYKSWDEAWDSLFEVGDRFDGPDAFRTELAIFCAAVRASTLPTRMEQDGTLERERFMWQTIQRELAQRGLQPEHAMVVCGGFHLFLDRHDPTPPPELPRGTTYSTLMPYSYFRVSDLSGYGAGNRAPAYYARLFEAGQQAKRAKRPSKGDVDWSSATQAMVDHVVDTLRRGRKRGERLSSADAIAITEHARMLAKLRGRQAPLLDDIRDAIVTCCCKGDPESEGVHLARAMRDAEIGTAIGRVTAKIGQLPLLHDFYLQLEELELTQVMGAEKRLDVVLDLRDSAAARKSSFLHRARFLDLPFATLVDRGTAGTLLFRERWRLLWTPNIEPELVEKNLYGDSVERAALALLEERVAEQEGHAGATCEKLVSSVSMEFPGLIISLYAACSAAIEADGSFTSLCSAVAQLGLLDRMAAHRDLSRGLIQRLLGRAFDRAAFAVPTVADVPNEELAAVSDGLKVLAEALLSDDAELFDRELLVENLRGAARDTQSPTLRGVFDGLLAEIRAEEPEFLARRLSAFALERSDVLVTAGAYLDGVLSVSRTSVMLGAEALVRALDELFRVATWDAFVVMLPQLRGAFERLHDRQRDSMAARVATQLGLTDSAALVSLGTSVEGAVALAEIDATTARIMEAWAL